VEVRVRRAAGVLEVRVRDNGVPGPPEAPGPSAGGGFGLAGLAERVLAHGGEFAAGPGPEGGFTVTARWPDRAGQANPDPASTMSG
jgi:signal transduction histidine kinase